MTSEETIKSFKLNSKEALFSPTMNKMAQLVKKVVIKEVEEREEDE